MTSVLVVDDDETIRGALTTLLQDEGYTVSEAADGNVALEHMRAHEVGLVVLLDLNMPQADGFAVVQAVELDPPLAERLVIIIMSAQDRTLPLAFVEQLTRLQLAVLPKPFDIEKLLTAVASAAERLHAGHEERGTDA